MTGLELQAELRSRDPDLPVVLTTAFGSAALTRAALGSGALGLLEKPFVVNELMSLLEQARVLRQQRRQDPGIAC